MFGLPETMQERLVIVLAHFVWQGTAVAVVLAALVAALNVRRPSLRYASSLLAFVLMSACPIATWFVLPDSAVPDVSPALDQPREPRLTRLDGDHLAKTERLRHADLADFKSQISNLKSEISAQSTASHVPANATTTSARGSSNWLDRLRPFGPWIIGVWLCGVGVLSLRLLLGAIGIWRWRRAVADLPDSLTSIVERLRAAMSMQQPRVCVCRRVAEAVAVGLVKPMILLPAAWVTELPPDMLEAVLAHELAHIRRLDLWVNLWQRLVETLLFYHPAVWWLSRRLRVERELCCDDLAATVTHDRLRYAETLEHVARLTRTRHVSPDTALAVAMSSREGVLLHRVRQLLGVTPPPRTGSAWLAGLLTLGLVLTIALGTFVSSRAKTEPRSTERSVEQPRDATKTSLALADIIQRLKNEEQKYVRIEVVVKSQQPPLRILDNETQQIEIVRRLIRERDRSYYLEESNCRIQETGATSRITREETIQGRWWRQRIESTGPGDTKHSDDSLAVLPKANHRLSPHTLPLGGWADRPESLSDVLTDETPGRRTIVELLGDENIGAERCVKLKDRDLSAGPFKSYHLRWLALDKNLLPVRNELRDENVEKRQPVFVTQVTEWLEIQPGIWFPKRIEAFQQPKSGTTSGKVEMEQTHTLTVEVASLQPQIDRSLFDKLGKPPRQSPRPDSDDTGKNADGNALRGTIRWVDQPIGFAWINLGEADSVKSRMMFEVRAKAPADGKDQAPVVKGTVEVTRIIDPHTSEVRILKDDLANRIAKGDDVILLELRPARLPPVQGYYYDSAVPRRGRPVKPTTGSVSPIKKRGIPFQKQSVREVEPPLDPTVKELIARLDSAEKQQRGEAIVELGLLKEKAGPAAAKLVEQLGETKLWVTVGNHGSAIAGHAELALAWIGTAAGPAMIDGLKHNNIEVRRRCAQVLGRIKEARAVEPLIAVLGDADRELANHATTALGHIGAPAVEPLLKVLASRSGQSRQQAAGALGLTKDARAIEPLVAALQADDPLLRQWAAHALSNNLTDESKKSLSRPEITQRLLAALKTDSREVRGTLSSLLVHLAPSIADQLIAALDDPDARVQEGALQAMFNVRDDRALKPLLRIAAARKTDQDSGDVERWAAAISALRNSISTLEKPDDVLDVLLPALKDKSPRIRQAAASTLWQIAEHWRDDKRPVEPLIAALQAEPERFALHQIVQTLAEYRDPRAVEPLLAVLERAETIRQSGDTPREKLKPEQVRASDDSIRDQVGSALGKIGDARAIPALRKLLPRQRPLIIEALGELHDRESVPEFIAALKRPGPWTSERIDLATSAARALAQTPDERALAPLIEALSWVPLLDFRRDPFVGFRYELCNAVAATGDPRAVDALLTFARSWDPPDSHFLGIHDDGDGIGLNSPAAGPLMSMGAIALPRLIEELKTTPPDRAAGADWPPDPTRSGREVAAYVLDGLFLVSNLPPEDAVPALPALIAALQDRSPLVRQCAIRALGSLHAEQAIPAIIKLVDEPRHSSDVMPRLDAGANAEFNQRQRDRWQRRTEHIHSAIASALSWIGDERGAAASAKLLQHDSPKVRTHAVYAVLATKHPQAIELLLPLLSEKDNELRQTVVRQLGFSNDRRVVEPLIGKLRTEATLAIRATAAQSLGLLGDRSAAGALAEVFPNGEHELRLRAAVALLQLNDDRGLEPLRKLLTEEPAKVRAETMEHLSDIAESAAHHGRSKLEHAAARELLLRVVTTDPDSRVRGWGTGTLRGFSDNATVAALLTLTKDSSELARNGALMVLADTTDPRRIDALLAALQDEQARVRAGAALMLRTINTPPIVTALTAALRDKDETVREAALGSLVELKAASAIAAIDDLIQNDPSPKVRLRAQKAALSLRGK